MSRKWIWWRIVQIIIDFLGIWGCFVLAYFVRVGWIFSTDFPFEPYALVTFISAMVWSFFLLFTRFYRIIPGTSRTEVFLQVGKIFLGGAGAVASVIVLYFFQEELFFSRLINLYALLFGMAWLLLSTTLFEQLLRFDKTNNQQAVYRTLIIGANRVAESIIEKFKTDPFAPYEIIGVIDPYGLAAKDFQGKVFGKLNKLESVCEKENITAIIQCDAFEHTINLISLAQERDIKFLFDPALRGVLEQNLRIRRNAGQTMIQFVDRDFSGSKKTKYQVIDWILHHIFDTD